ncbi:hypothetical protein D918_04614 [Trichuris suis]|nr:hypothetical protein D918_04614 [Trichuris suis]
MDCSDWDVNNFGQVLCHYAGAGARRAIVSLAKGPIGSLDIRNGKLVRHDDDDDDLLKGRFAKHGHDCLPFAIGSLKPFISIVVKLFGHKSTWTVIINSKVQPFLPTRLCCGINDGTVCRRLKAESKQPTGKEKKNGIKPDQKERLLIEQTPVGWRLVFPAAVVYVATDRATAHDDSLIAVGWSIEKKNIVLSINQRRLLSLASTETG